MRGDDRVGLTPGLVVGGFPEPDGSQPMSAAEFRMVSEAVGLSQVDLASWLGVADRSVRRWIDGTHPVPHGVREALEQREAVMVAVAEQAIAAVADSSEVVLSIPSTGTPPETPAFWRRVAYRVAESVPGLYVRYSPTDDARPL